MPLVTVGLPFFDEERHLGDAIRSVLGQTFADFELLLVDDGSRDGSLAIARSFSDPRIRLISDGVRRHLPARLNEIVRRASSPYIARVDADDVIHSTRLQKQLARFDSEPSCDVVGTWATLVDGHGRPFGVIESDPLPPTPESTLTRGVLPHATVLGRRAWFAANPYNESLTRAEDRDLWCRTAATSHFDIVRECLYVIRVDTDKQSFLTSYIDSQRQNEQIFAKYGPAMVGRMKTARMIAAARAKVLVMGGLVRLGLVDRLVQRRGRVPHADEIAMAREALVAAAQRA